MAIRSFKGTTPMCGERVFIDEASVVIGNVTLGDDTSVWPTAVIRGDMHHIRIGARTSIQDGAVLHITHASEYNPEGYPLLVGSDVTVGHRAVLHGCTIHDRVLVGMGAVVLDGVVVESDVLIAAGAMVPPGKRLESGYVYAGNPVKALRPLKDEEYAFFDYSAGNYVRLKDDFLEESGQ